MTTENDSSTVLPCLESCMAPEEGKDSIMYHGTSIKAAMNIFTEGFLQSEDGMLGHGVYLSRDLQKVSRYPLDLLKKERVVQKVKVNVGRVKMVDHQDHTLKKTWHDHGYDTAWCPLNCAMVSSSLKKDCVWNPKQITILSKELDQTWVILKLLNPVENKM